MSYKIAGIEVYKRVLMVVVMDASRPEEKPERRRFTTMPSNLRRLSCWLREQGVEEAVMESTAQYGRAVWLELEPHLRLQLAQAFSNRAPRGRKHDFKDAERLVRRLIANELILSFVPDGEQRTWRKFLTRKNSSTRTYIGSAACDRKLWRKPMPGTGSLISGRAGTDLVGAHFEIHSMCNMAISLPRPTSWAATGVAPVHSPDSTRPADHSVPRSAR